MRARIGPRRRRVAAIVAAVMAAITAVAFAPPTSAQEHGTGMLPPGDWTGEQEAYLLDLIERTEAALPAFGDPATLEELGFFNFGVVAPGGYDHWINLEWLDDGHILDPEFPESVVFRYRPDGSYVIEAAMFFLPTGTELSTIPENLAWLPGWHTHPELCVDENGQFAGLVNVDGTCSSGSPSDMPPMMHVWIVDTACGHRFGGVGVGGLDCDVDHGTPGPHEPPDDGHGDDGHGDNGNMDDGGMDDPAPRPSAPPAQPVSAKPTFTG